jgi:hypothetical protein
MLELNKDKLQSVTVEAFDKAQGSKRWQSAIVKAKMQLESNPYLDWQDNPLLILSPESNEIYTANGTCQCKAYTKGFPCWHRAAARIVKRYMEQ